MYYDKVGLWWFVVDLYSMLPITCHPSCHELTMGVHSLLPKHYIDSFLSIRKQLGVAYSALKLHKLAFLAI